jgi:hypothetical protein
MGRLLRFVGLALLAVAALAVLVGMLARFSDGPIGPFPGGPLRSGEFAAEPPRDWSFAREVGEIELQTAQPEVSRTVWVLVVDGELYVPCGYPQAKRWPEQVARDADAVLRIEGMRYRGRLERVSDPALLERLLAEAVRKYRVGDSPDLRENTWVYRFETGAAD